MKKVLLIIAFIAALIGAWFLGKRSAEKGLAEPETSSSDLKLKVKAPVRNAIIFKIDNKENDVEYFVKFNNGSELKIYDDSMYFQVLLPKEDLDNTGKKTYTNTIEIYGRKNGVTIPYGKSTITYSHKQVLNLDSYLIYQVVRFDASIRDGKAPGFYKNPEHIFTPAQSPPIKPITGTPPIGGGK